MAPKIAFIKAAVLTDVTGRIDYVSNPERQIGKKELKEKLLAFYQTPEDPNFWKELGKVNHQNNAKYNKSDTVVEAREHILQISNEIYKIATPEDHAKIAKTIAQKFKEEYGVEVAVGIHMNDNVSDYHAHIVFAERVCVPGDPNRETAKRNTYFDESGKRSTKAACTDEHGRLRRGCRLVKKGEAFPQRMFGAKKEEFSKPAWLKKEKERQAKFMTELCREYGVSQEWIRYDHKTNPHMRLYNLKRGEPAGLRAWKEVENEKIRAYNRMIDRLIADGTLTKEEALALKDQIYAERRAKREEIKTARIAYVNSWSEEEQLRREEDYAVKRWLYYREDGTRRGLIEAFIILGMVLCGVDLKRFAIEGYGEIDENLRVEPATRSRLHVESSNRIQAMADDLARAAGRRTATEMIEEHKIRQKVETKKTSSLDALISGAERQATAPRTGERVEPELHPDR